MNNKLLNEILEARELPTLPRVAVRVLDLASEKEVSFGRIAEAICDDPVLAAKILKMVNSSFYGISQPVKTINHALVLLGLQTIKAVAVGFSLVRGVNARRSETFDYVRFWRQSLYTAVFARALAKLQFSEDCEEAFLAGLLSDLGTLTMHRALGKEYDAVLEACGGSQKKLLRLSHESFDLDHAVVGAALAERWNLPPSLVVPIRNHLTPDNGTDSRDLIEAVHSGALCAQVFAATQSGFFEAARRRLDSVFGLSWTQTNDLFAEIDAKTSEMAALLEIGMHPGRSYQEVEEEAREALIQLTLTAQRQAEAALVQNKRLNALARTDGLTGLSNRRHFTEFLLEAFTEAVETNKPLSLIMLDIDRFKSVNDTYGHQAGDAVLENVAALVKSATPESGLSARYGGEEMAIVLKGISGADAMEFAEQLRLAVADVRTTLDRLTIPVTASLGVATVDQDNPFTSPDEIIGAADRALYAAKEGGRNCVRSIGNCSKRDAA